MAERPWRSPFVDDRSTEYLLESLERRHGRRRSRAAIIRAAKQFLLSKKKWEKAARRLGTKEFENEALYAVYSNPPPRRGDKLTPERSHNLVASDRYRDRLRLHLEGGLTEKAAHAAALADEKAGAWLPDYWRAERAYRVGRIKIAQALLERGEKLPEDLAADFKAGELPEQPNRLMHPVESDSISDQTGLGSAAGRIRQRTNRSRDHWKKKRGGLLRLRKNTP